MKTTQMRSKRGYLFYTCYRKVVNHQHLYLAET